MPRALFEKTGNAVWISHLDLMRLFQRSFKRSGLLLTHTQGFNPRPSVSIALPLSVGIESRCELLDFDLEGEQISNAEIMQRLNENLVSGVKILAVYDDFAKIKNLAYLDCVLTMEYDGGIPAGGQAALAELFSREEVIVEKRTKNGPKPENIIPLIRSIQIERVNDQILKLHARICCQNPALNPMQLHTAVEQYLPSLKPDFVRCSRIEVYDTKEIIFR